MRTTNPSGSSARWSWAMPFIGSGTRSAAVRFGQWARSRSTRPARCSEAWGSNKTVLEFSAGALPGAASARQPLSAVQSGRADAAPGRAPARHQLDQIARPIAVVELVLQDVF